MIFTARLINMETSNKNLANRDHPFGNDRSKAHPYREAKVADSQSFTEMSQDLFSKRAEMPI